jgi:hypothetical protein
VIRYALLCEHDHDFEAWFSTSADFDGQAARGQVECPWCASHAIRKAIMTPAVSGTKRESAGSEASASPELRTMMMEAAQKVRDHVEQNFDNVGDRFAREARAIHEGYSEPRGIFGQATPEEVKALREDGVPVAPLPAAAAPKPKSEIN